MVYKPDKKQLKQARERLKDRKNRGTDDEYFKNLIEQLENGPWPTFVQQTKGARQERARIRAAVAEMREKWSKNQDPTNTWYFIGRLAAYDDILRFLDPAAEPEAHNAH
ncbi:hypothetical protein [Desulfoscipio geothermicus]|nr:hypothetical protein [Desulfoscipio geothermicus]